MAPTIDPIAWAEETWKIVGNSFLNLKYTIQVIPP